MVKKSKLLKLLVSLGAKGILCIICLASVGAALVTFSTAVTLTSTVQLTQGVNTAAWTIYVNEQNLIKYIPGGAAELTLDTGNTATYSFKVVTDANKVCAVQVGLVAAVDDTKFSKFDITVRSSTGEGWSDETLYAASTGTGTKAAVNGLVADDVAYIHQAESTTKYYEVKVTYSYDLLSSDAGIGLTLNTIPLPQDSFA